MIPGLHDIIPIDASFKETLGDKLICSAYYSTRSNTGEGEKLVLPILELKVRPTARLINIKLNKLQQL